MALRGNPELRKEVLGSGGKRGRAGLRDHLQDALNKVPAAAAAALTYLGGWLSCYWMCSRLKDHLAGALNRVRQRPRPRSHT